MAKSSFNQYISNKKIGKIEVVVFDCKTHSFPASGTTPVFIHLKPILAE